MKSLLQKTISILISLTFLLIVSWNGYDYFWYRSLIPEKIGISYPIGISGESGFREGCGAAAFHLSSVTAKAIEKEKILFFADVTTSRKQTDNYHTFEQWKETPLPDSWISEGAWPGLGCWNPFISLFVPIKSKIIEAAKESGSYYSNTTDGEILVIPSLNLVVYSYFG